MNSRDLDRLRIQHLIAHTKIGVIIRRIAAAETAAESHRIAQTTAWEIIHVNRICLAKLGKRYNTPVRIDL